MKQNTPPKGQQYLKHTILNTELCTGCGACIDLCPYQASHRDRTVILHSCDLDDCRGYRYCPRTPVDVDAMKKTLFDPKTLTPEIGAVEEFWLTRAADKAVRERAQHGGTTTALLGLALELGLIDTAVTASQDRNLVSSPGTLTDKDALLSTAGSRFVVSPTVAAVNRMDLSRVSGVGVVATPCQALALAKMKLDDDPRSLPMGKKLKLVIGLFCGWALSWDKTADLLAAHDIPLDTVTGLDIPPSQYQILEVRTQTGQIDIPLDQVNDCIRPSCGYCDDLTAEFSDISVGSARLPEGWETAKKWNQVIVRSKTGRELLQKARQTGVLEFMEPAPESLDKLKRAAAGKRRSATEKNQKES